MKLKTLDGFIYNWQPGKEVGKNKDKSSLHKLAHQILLEEFPLLTFCEEVPVRVLKYKQLYFDFYIPLFSTAIEVHGQQHYSFSAFFHKDIFKFLEYRKNDKLKYDFCIQNNIEILELEYDRTDSWRERIRAQFKKT